MPMTREQVIDRIAKLRRMTTDAGASEAEAAKAAEAISKLMAEYDIGLTEESLRAAARQAGGLTHKWFGEIVEPFIMADVCWEIGRLFHCKAWREKAYEDPLDLGMWRHVMNFHFAGLEADVEAALALSDIIYAAIGAEYASWLKAEKQRKGKDKFISFRQGISARLCQRLKELANVPQQRGLVLVKDELVHNFVAGMGLKFKQARAESGHNAQAFQAGHQRGGNVDLGHGRALRGAQLRIGR